MPRLVDVPPQVDLPSTSVVFDGLDYVLTRTAVSHLRNGDRLFGVNVAGNVFVRTVTAAYEGATPEIWYVHLNRTVRPTSIFPLPREFTQDAFMMRRGVIVPAHLTPRIPDA